MTLLQLKYVVTVAAAGTISEAAKRLYMAQPSLTAAIKELEHELGITIFKRTNKGILISPEGEEFLGYARQVIEQTNLIEERYLGAAPVKHQFCVSTQHYSFAVEAFVELLKQYGGDEYDFRIRETQTYELIEDVAKLRTQKQPRPSGRGCYSFHPAVLFQQEAAVLLKAFSVLGSKFSKFKILSESKRKERQNLTFYRSFGGMS